MDLHPQNNEGDCPILPAPRMSPDEAQAVIRLWQQEQVDSSGLTSRPSLADMAESLDIAPDEACRLLAQVRGAQSGGDIQHARIDREHRRLARRLAWVMAAALAAWLLQFLGFS